MGLPPEVSQPSLRKFRNLITAILKWFCFSHFSLLKKNLPKLESFPVLAMVISCSHLSYAAKLQVTNTKPSFLSNRYSNSVGVSHTYICTHRYMNTHLPKRLGHDSALWHRLLSHFPNILFIIVSLTIIFSCKNFSLRKTVHSIPFCTAVLLSKR